MNLSYYAAQLLYEAFQVSNQDQYQFCLDNEISPGDWEEVKDFFKSIDPEIKHLVESGHISFHEATLKPIPDVQATMLVLITFRYNDPQVVVHGPYEKYVDALKAMNGLYNYDQIDQCYIVRASKHATHATFPLVPIT